MGSTCKFDVKVIDGEGMALPSVEVGARYHYSDGPSTWGAESTDSNGHAWFDDEHAHPPRQIALFVLGEDCGRYEAVAGSSITIEM